MKSDSDTSASTPQKSRWRASFPWQLPADDLLRRPMYRRLWTSILMSSLGGQITLLAIPLTAAVLLHASPVEMGWLTAMEILPFVLLSLPSGVWLDRVRKLPVYIYGELLLSVFVALVPLLHLLGALTMNWLYVIGFLIGAVYTVAGSAAQVVLTQVVERERLVEAHAKNALASSGAEVAGPGLAGALIKAVGAPIALLVDAVFLMFSALILKGVRIQEPLPSGSPPPFWQQLKEGMAFVRKHPLLVRLALTVGGWQLVHQAAVVVQILFATRELGLSESSVGLSYVALGVGTVSASLLGNRISERWGPGPTLIAGAFICGLGWLALSFASHGPWGIALFVFNLCCFGVGAVLMFINFLALRQAVTPAPLLGRMTSIMRWLILLPAGPGALLGGWIGEHYGLRWSLAFAGVGAWILVALAWQSVTLRQIKKLPQAEGATECPTMAGSRNSTDPTSENILP